MSVNANKRLFTNKDRITGLSLFAFFLSFYSIIFFIQRLLGHVDPNCISDECGYIEFAENIIKGFYSPPAPDISLHWGPGFPLLLVPLKLFNIQRHGIIILNILLSSCTIGILFFSSRLFLSYRISIIISSIWGFYYIHYHSIFSAHSEVFASLLFLLSFFIYSLYTITPKPKYLFCSGFLFGYLILTKVIFSYVLILFIIPAILIYLSKKRFKSILAFMVVALAVTVPYQIYTYNLTGKVFYFSNGGGRQLYWMTTPHKGEFGEWNNKNFDANCGFIEDEIPCNKELYRKNHGEFYSQIEKLPIIDRDDAFKKKSISNIRQYPFKYLRNISSNITRMLFNIPNSYFYQRDITTTARLFPNSILLTLILTSVLITFGNLSRFSPSIKFYIAIAFTYLILSSLVSSYPRMLNIIVPFILIWTSYSISFWKKN